MEDQKKRPRKYGMILIGVTLLAAACICLAQSAGAEISPPDGGTFCLTEPWKVAGQAMPMDLTQPKQLTVPANMALTISTVLPKDLPENVALLCRTSQQTLRIAVGGKTIYTYAPEITANWNQAAPSGWHLIQLEPDSAGKTITLTFDSPFSDYAGMLEPVRCGTYGALEHYLLKSYGINIVLSDIMLVLGALLIALTIVWKEPGSRGLVWLGLLGVDLGIWSMGESKLVEFLPGNALCWKMLTFLALAYAPLFYAQYANTVLTRENTRSGMSALRYVLLGNAAFQTLNCLFHWKDPVLTLWLTQSCLFCIVLIQSLWLAKEFYRRGWQASVCTPQVVGILILTAGLFGEWLVFFLVSKRYTGICMRIALVVFLVVLILSAMQSMTKQAAEYAKMEKQLTNYRIAIAISQVQPHFLYNTLNSIRALIHMDSEAAYQLVGDLSRYLRNNLEGMSNNSLISFTEELEHVRTYIRIEKFRFGDRIRMVYDIGCSDFSIPAISVQPLVENAVKHGICKRIGGGVVTLRTYELKHDYIVEIHDDGVGFDTTVQWDNSHVGLENVRFRLATALNASLTLQSKVNEGTIATIRIPKGESIV